MRNLIIYLALSLCLFVSKVAAQESFETKAKAIAEKIEKIAKEEKEALKLEIEAVNTQLESGSITKEQADDKKKKLAEARATIIENKVNAAQEELKELVQAKVDGKLNHKNNEYNISIKTKKDTTVQKSESRTTSQFVFAAGLNNVATGGKVDQSDFRYWGSHFYEWGITSNTRLLKNSNILHFKYGFSFMYNNLRPTEKRIFDVAGDKTNLIASNQELQDSRFKNVNLVIPMHLEFDFSKTKNVDGKPFFRSHEGFRVGLGGYLGTNLKTKQYINYEVDGYETKTVTKGNFNTSNFIYGLSGYIGYKETSLYVKYDLNTLFTDNLVKQNNVSVGVRFDFN